MCFEYLDALCPVGIALLSILHAKAFILGSKLLFSQILFRRESVASSGGVGVGEPALVRACRQVL
jgi:hypothetical protein